MSLKLVLATANSGKVLEFKGALSPLPLELVSAAELGVTRFPAENGLSYEENALLKAGYVALATGCSSLGDDSGLEVDALGGAPGIYSARYGGQLSDGERVSYLLSQLREVPRGARGAVFVCCLVLATPGGQLKTFRGECRGDILMGPKGQAGFGYDPIFYSPELGKTFAEGSKEEKQRVSHRGRALKAFIDWALTAKGKRTMSDVTPVQEGHH